MIAKFIKESWLVIIAALVFGLLVAFVHGQLEERINENGRGKVLQSMAKLFLQKETVTQADTDSLKVEQVAAGDLSYYKVRRADGELLGYGFETEGGGFADTVRLLVTVDASREKLMGIGILKSNETPGFGDKMKEPAFKDQFSGKPVPTPEAKLKVIKKGQPAATEIMAITGATISSNAVVKIVNDGTMAIVDKLH